MPLLKYGTRNKVIYYTQGEYESDNLANFWRYSTASNGQITLQEYLGTSTGISVPKKNGLTIIGSLSSNRPFYNNQNITSVGLNNVPWVNNNMAYGFFNCSNLIYISDINPYVNTIAVTFQNCYNFNQPIQVPNSVTNMYSTFYRCNNFNAPVFLGNSVETLFQTFSHCTNFNQPIQIPNSVTVMSSTFYDCQSFNQNVQIPNSVVTMPQAFFNCKALTGTISIFSENIDSVSSCFKDTSLPKDVYIPYNYANNERTVTFNSFVTAGYLDSSGASTGINGVTMHDLNA